MGQIIACAKLLEPRDNIYTLFDFGGVRYNIGDIYTYHEWYTGCPKKNYTLFDFI